MAREIKFRAWDLDNSAMYYSDREEDSGEGPIIWGLNSDNQFVFSEITIIDECPGGGEHEQRYDYREPKQAGMQYTGLKDSKGNDIWEGDEVESIALFNDHNQKGSKEILVVRYFQGNFCLCCGNQESGVPIYPFNVNHTLEVIGNIHELVTDKEG